MATGLEDALICSGYLPPASQSENARLLQELVAFG
jgi:hypothetical protein